MIARKPPKEKLYLSKLQGENISVEPLTRGVGFPENNGNIVQAYPPKPYIQKWQPLQLIKPHDELMSNRGYAGLVKDRKISRNQKMLPEYLIGKTQISMGGAEIENEKERFLLKSEKVHGSVPRIL
jgi:hypothetical protein